MYSDASENSRRESKSWSSKRFRELARHESQDNDDNIPRVGQANFFLYTRMCGCRSAASEHVRELPRIRAAKKKKRKNPAEHYRDNILRVKRANIVFIYTHIYVYAMKLARVLSRTLPCSRAEEGEEKLPYL